ncbi:MAG: hypothetical protein DRH26_02240 [Deltaproteobacteria bacterium]|nr:MAG: hypothetical protein DRH26_02240 [Deltaproteobacteria bacterium]
MTQKQTLPMPHDQNAEIAILGAILLNPSKLAPVRQIISADDFYKEAHKKIFTVMCEIEDISYLTVIQELQKKKQIEQCGGEDYILYFVESVSVSAGVEHQARVIKGMSDKRALIHACMTASEACFDGRDDLPEIMAGIKDAIRKIEFGQVTETMTPTQLLKSALDLIEERSKTNQVGVLTGIQKIDNRLAGLEKGCSYIIMAESTIGKSAVCLNIADNVSATLPEEHVLLFTLESTDKILTMRRISRKTRIPLTRLRKGNIRHGEWEELIGSSDALAQRNLQITDKTAYANMEKLTAYCHTYAMSQKVSLIVIDYIQLMNSSVKYSSKHLELSAIAKQINFLAKEIDCPVICVSQETDGKTRESGDIFTFSDNVLRLTKDNETSGTIHIDGQKGKDTGKWFTDIDFDKYTMRVFNTDNSEEQHKEV